MRGFPHSVVLQQISADQPRISVWFLLLFVPIWLPYILTQGLMLWPPFIRVVADHHTSYFLIFFVVQMSLTCGAILFLSKRYASALWYPQTQSRSHRFDFLLILMPLLLFHLSDCLSIFPSIIVLPSIATANELSQTLASMHQDIWGRLAYGSSLTGVVCESIITFVSPVLEEILFSGLLANRLARSFGVTVAVLGAPVCFALIHAVQFGLGPHLIALFFAGLTYTIIRFYSGSLLMAVFSHLAINFVIFVPKWIVAVMHFTHV
jgi:membrane protease YdiL (CAAX protease family)